jgi:hypothetical protein
LGAEALTGTGFEEEAPAAELDFPETSAEPVQREGEE